MQESPRTLTSVSTFGLLAGSSLPCKQGLRLCLSGVCAEVRPQRSAADVRRELEAREESRNTVKLIWRALASMASGQPNTLCISALFWPRVSFVNTQALRLDICRAY